MEPLIVTTHDLSVGYQKGKTEIVVGQHIDITLRKGKLVALIGANGIGKSTLLRTLIGIQKPISGRVLLDEKEIGTYIPSELSQKLSVVLTEKLPPSNLSVFELVALGRQPYTNWIGKLSEEDLIQIDNALALTQTDGLSNKKHYELSDGQLQKVLIARALAQNTRLIILDEPTTHLDLQHKASVFKLLKKLAAETDKCILFSTHDIEMALQLSDEIIAMTADRVVQQTPELCKESGILDELFPDGSVYFDIQNGKFLFKDI